jgi:hypothetical protein
MNSTMKNADKVIFHAIDTYAALIGNTREQVLAKYDTCPLVQEGIFALICAGLAK